jgi:hypothetical protein
VFSVHHIANGVGATRGEQDETVKNTAGNDE